MITLLIPAYNEEAVIGDLLKDIKKDVNLSESYEVLIVDDGSTDDTKKIVSMAIKKDKRIRLVEHKKNKGVGGALFTGFSKARGRIIVTLDSDMSHPPVLISKMVAELDRKNVDVCIASRYVRGGGMKDVPFRRVLLSKLSNLSFGMLFGTMIGDLTAGFKAYKQEAIRKIHIQQYGFEVQLEIMVKLIKHGAKVCEIPLMLKNRDKGTSKFNVKKAAHIYFATVLNLFFYRWFT